MSWKFVLNGNLGNFKNPVEVSIAAEREGYKFFLFDGKVYFKDKISLRFFETGLTEKDLF